MRARRGALLEMWDDEMWDDLPYSPFHVNRRSAERLVACLPARVVLADGRAHVAETTDLSADGVALVSDAPVAEGEVVTCLVAQIGLATGAVVRVTTEGFVVAFDPPGRRERARALAWLEEALEGARADLRASERYLPPPGPIDFRIGEEAASPVTLVDLSFGGARVMSHARPAIGTRVRLGPLAARVVRHTENGLAIAFTES